MSAIDRRSAHSGPEGARLLATEQTEFAPAPRAKPREGDPRVVRTRKAVLDAARVLFLRQGYAGTTMEDIAAEAGLTKRTLYNNYADKEALFLQIIADISVFADDFARGLRAEFAADISARQVEPLLQSNAERLVVGIVRSEVLALRRLLIGEARAFPELAAQYFDRAPGQVIDTLAEVFQEMSQRKLLRVQNARMAALQFAYLVVGEPLDRAMLTGVVPSRDHMINCAREGVRTFLARYGGELRA